MATVIQRRSRVPELIGLGLQGYSLFQRQQQINQRKTMQDLEISRQIGDNEAVRRNLGEMEGREYKRLPIPRLNRPTPKTLSPKEMQALKFGELIRSNDIEGANELLSKEGRVPDQKIYERAQQKMRDIEAFRSNPYNTADLGKVDKGQALEISKRDFARRVDEIASDGNLGRNEKNQAIIKAHSNHRIELRRIGDVYLDRNLSREIPGVEGFLFKGRGRPVRKVKGKDLRVYLYDKAGNEQQAVVLSALSEKDAKRKAAKEYPGFRFITGKSRVEALGKQGGTTPIQKAKTEIEKEILKDVYKDRAQALLDEFDDLSTEEQKKRANEYDRKLARYGYQLNFEAKSILPNTVGLTTRGANAQPYNARGTRSRSFR